MEEGLIRNMNKVSKVIIPAAGLGTKFLPFTKICRKRYYQLSINQPFNL
jgi:UTP-glucose-1-phosphate uridylyltransferase